MSEFVRVCRVEEVVDGRARAIEVSGSSLALFRDGDRFFALYARCSHAAGALDLGWVEDSEAVCPLHRWRFRLGTGRCTTVRGESVSAWPCEVREGWVWVATKPQG